MKIAVTIVVSGIILLAGLPGGPAAEAPGTNAPAADPLAQYAGLHKSEIELSARFYLLKELGDAHAQRAEAAAKANDPGKSKWELELGNELKARAAEAATQLDLATKQRLALEEKAKPTGQPILLSAEETAFLSKLDTTLWAVEQDLIAAVELGRNIGAELVTNNTPEDVARISYQVQENDRRIKYLERDRSLLELQRLEYRALRKK